MLSMMHHNKRSQPTYAREKEVRVCEVVFWTKQLRDLIYLAATCCSTSLTSFNPAGVASRRVGQSGVCVRKLRNLLGELDVASMHRRTDNPRSGLPIQPRFGCWRCASAYCGSLRMGYVQDRTHWALFANWQQSRPREDSVVFISEPGHFTPNLNLIPSLL
ncbi:hypothetical protein BDW68DRAFT_123087 [Aspergillus falconensis]